jgi:DNA-binding NarL/FixJ family response regulator
LSEGSSERVEKRGLEGERRGPVRIGIVDDHPVFRLGLTRALERQPGVEVVWELSSAANLDAAMHKTPVDVLLVDIYLGPGKDGIAATRDVLAKWPKLKVAAMSASLDAKVSTASKRAGASLFLPKSAPVSEMVASIRGLVASRGGSRAGRRAAGATRIDSLSPRQRQVLEFIRLGRTNKEIASRLSVSVATVNKHVHEILGALGVSNRTQAAAVARESSD